MQPSKRRPQRARQRYRRRKRCSRRMPSRRLRNLPCRRKQTQQHRRQMVRPQQRHRRHLRHQKVQSIRRTPLLLRRRVQQQAAAPEPPPATPPAQPAPTENKAAAAAADATPQPVVEPPASPPSPAAPAPAPAAAEPPKAPPAPAANAEAERPAPNPKATVVAGVHQSGNSMRVEFPFAVATPAAIFYRADTLWLVFDSAAPIDLSALRNDNESGVREAIVRARGRRCSNSSHEAMQGRAPPASKPMARAGSSILPISRRRRPIRLALPAASPARTAQASPYRSMVRGQFTISRMRTSVTG